MSNLRLNRRAVIRGAGGIAVALPWLEIMGTERRASAAPAPANRFVSVYQPGGTVRAKYTPTGTETAPILSPILAPLQPVLSKILIVDGLEMKAAGAASHPGGMVAFLTGTSQASGKSYSHGPSVDQVIATRLSAGKKKFPSLEFAVRWATGLTHGLQSPFNVVNYEDNATFSPIPPRIDPVQVFKDLFTGVMPGSGGMVDGTIQRKKSILDYVDKSLAGLSPKLGANDRTKIDQHLTKIRELERSIMVPPTPPGGTCKAPAIVDTSDYNPTTGLMSANDGSIKDIKTDAAIPKVGQYFMDMLVMALACDMTNVATLQWTDAEAKHTFPWLSLPQHHHMYQHDGGFQPVQCAQIATWYSQMHLYLLQAMVAVDMGGHTLLDESVVYFGSELQDPPTHVNTNMPFLLAGNGGGLRTGRWVTYSGLPHNNLLVSILNLFGDTRTTFGEPRFCTGPLTNIV